MPNPTTRWVNWLELVEYFLRNPAAQVPHQFVEAQCAGNITHTVVDTPTRFDSLANLSRMYKRTAKFVETEEYLYWEAIADANFNIGEILDRSGITDISKIRKTRKDLINEILSENHWGYPVRMKPNYAFKNGLVVVIPFQKQNCPTAPLDDKNLKWFQEVMKSEAGWEVFPGYTDVHARQSKGPLKHHTVVYLSGRQDALSQVSLAQKMRTASEQAYRPTAVR